MELKKKIPMTKERLKQYRVIKIEIMELKNKLVHLGDGDSMVGNSVIMDYRGGYPRPHSVIGTDWDKIKRTAERYEKKISKLEKEFEEIEKFIDEIDDTRTRCIFRLRFMEGKTQNEIGKKMHLDQSVVSRIINEFLKVA